jgi:hypothetical protein
MRHSSVMPRAKQDRMDEIVVASRSRRWRKYHDRVVLERYGSHPFVTVAFLLSPVGRMEQSSGSSTRMVS